ncbi:hypothetical protein [Cellulomonas sp. ICMP 17802]|uniref:hypothetical protein n=1 Tax=Cellulomonas sp. ICMP 17802 TaxID=3239199 RepID=UPI00351B49AC
MSDLGHLLADTEAAVERRRSGAAPTASLLAGTVRRVRRRRAVRHSAQSVAGVGLVGVLGATAWFGAHRSAPAPVPAFSPTESPAPAASPTTAAAAAPPVHVGEPLPLPAGLIEDSSAGWMLVPDNQTRVGTDPYHAAADAYRNRLLLISPTGARNPVLETSVRTGLVVFGWTAGSPLVVASTTDYTAASPTDVAGLLDLRTGDLEPWPDLPPSALWIGGADDGTTVWAAPQWDFTDLPAGAVPMPRNVLSAQNRMTGYPGSTFHLLVRDPDGSQRDLGVIDDSVYPTSLSPDGSWVTATGPDGRLLLVDLRSGTATSASTVPTDRPCTIGGWSGPHEVLLSCGTPADLLALDATRPSATPRLLATSEHPVIDATPLPDGRVGLGLVVQGPPCDGGAEPGVLADGVVSSLTTRWGPDDHSYWLQFGGGTVVTDLNDCYVGHGTAGRQRTVSTDVTTGAVTELFTLEGEPTDDGWEHSLGTVVVGR